MPPPGTYVPERLDEMQFRQTLRWVLHAIMATARRRHACALRFVYQRAKKIRQIALPDLDVMCSQLS